MLLEYCPIMCIKFFVASTLSKVEAKLFVCVIFFITMEPSLVKWASDSRYISHRYIVQMGMGVWDLTRFEYKTNFGLVSSAILKNPTDSDFVGPQLSQMTQVTNSLRLSDAYMVSELIIGSDSGLSPGRRQTIMWTMEENFQFEP